MKNEQLKCSKCGKFIGYKERVFVYTYCASTTELDPPEPEWEHERCFEMGQESIYYSQPTLVNLEL